MIGRAHARASAAL